MAVKTEPAQGSSAISQTAHEAIRRLDAPEGHRLWAKTYDSETNPVVALAQRIFASYLDSSQNQVFLDVGCGTGQWMALAREGGARVIGIDLTAEMLRQAQSKKDLDGRVALGDAQRLPVRSHSADLILCSLAISYCPLAQLVFEEMARVVRPGGKVLVADFHPDAAARGWKRSFRAGSRTFELHSYFRGAENLIEAGRGAGLSLLERIDACFGPQEHPIFEKAGKESLWQSVAGLPAILATVWELPAG